MIYFVDENLNPFPPTILVAVTQMVAPTNGIVSLPENDYTQFGGYAEITIEPGVQYIASFAGSLAPTVSVTFTPTEANPTVIVVGYTSPTLALAGYSALARSKQTNGKYGSPDVTPLLNAEISGFVAGVELLDNEAMQVLAADRIQSSQGSNLDSWAADFFGGLLPRYSSEISNDELYYTRILYQFTILRTTYECIKNLVDTYFEQSPTGGTSGHDVFDTYTNPQKAAYYGLVAADAEFAIVEYFPVTLARVWYVGQKFLGQNAFIANPSGFETYNSVPYPELQQQIDFNRARGTKLLYIASAGDPFS